MTNLRKHTGEICLRQMRVSGVDTRPKNWKNRGEGRALRDIESTVTRQVLKSHNRSDTRRLVASRCKTSPFEIWVVGSYLTRHKARLAGAPLLPSAFLGECSAAFIILLVVDKSIYSLIVSPHKTILSGVEWAHSMTRGRK